MNTCPVVSIIVPVYKVEPYLARCLDSIKNQTFRDFEAILIDDGSPDQCGAICDSYAQTDARFQVLHTENHGLSAARNAGLDICCGKFVTFVDSDDWIAPDMLEHMITIRRQTLADIVGVDYICLKEGQTLPKMEPQFIVQCEQRQKSLLTYAKSLLQFYKDDAAAWGKLFLRQLFKEIRFPDGQLYEDVGTVFRLLRRSNMYARSNKVCYVYYQYPKTITASCFNLKDFDLIKASDDLLTQARLEDNAELVHLLEAKKTRCYFTLLGKIAKYGTSKNVNERAVSIEFLHKVRVNFRHLWDAPMPINRRLILLLMITYWPLAKRLIRFSVTMNYIR